MQSANYISPSSDVITNPAQRLLDTFEGIATDRCPVVPKIWFDLAARMTGTESRSIIESPRLGLSCIIDAALKVGSDAARMHLIPPRLTRWEGEQLIEVDTCGRRLGAIDLFGGWATHLDRAENFSIENPYHIAFRTSWKHGAPRVDTPKDSHRIAVPNRAFWNDQFGDHLAAVMSRAGNKLALIGDCDSATLAWYIEFRGMEQAMVDLLEEPAMVHSVMEKGVEYAIERGKFWIDKGLRILRLNDSVANMSVISPALWREFILPHMKSVCTELHRYEPSVKIYCHICGNVLPVISEMVETGLDAIGPLDPLGGFTVAQARQKGGSEITLYGGVNTLDFVRAEPDELFQQALRCIKEGQVNKSRFILGSGCVVPPGAKLENLLALRRASEHAARNLSSHNHVQ